MIVLSADNRSLLSVGPYSYLVDNVTSGQATISVVNNDGFSVDDFILIGLFGNENTEIFRIGSIDAANGIFTLHDKSGNPVNTKFSHTESTKVTRIPFNEIRFYWTAATGTIADETPVFDTNTPLSVWGDLTPSDWFTTFSDDGHSTGFGWFLFRNSVTMDASQSSNAIPYTGFATNTVQFVFNDFLSLLNNRELKLVTNADMFSWLNEGLSMVLNKLNLSNPEYTASTPQTITLLGGTSEYLLPADFGDLVQVSQGKFPVQWISLKDAQAYSGYYWGSGLRYYIRGRYIGFVPTPDGSSLTSYGPITYIYRSKGFRKTGLDDPIDLPDNGANIVKDWMMWRACLKFQNPNAQVFNKSFSDGLNQLIVSSLHRDANLDSWGIAPSANV